jgi:hypothetical protein
MSNRISQTDSPQSKGDRARIGAPVLAVIVIALVATVGIAFALGIFGGGAADDPGTGNGTGPGTSTPTDGGDDPATTQTTPTATPTQQPYQGDQTVVREPFESIAIDYIESLEYKNFEVTHANYSGNTAYFWITDGTPHTTDANSTDEWSHGFAMAFKQSWANETHTWGVDQIVVKYKRNSFYRLDEWKVHRIVVGDWHDIGVPMQTTSITTQKNSEVELETFLQEVNAIEGIAIRESENYGSKILLTVEAESTEKEYLTERVMRIENLSYELRTVEDGGAHVDLRIVDSSGDTVWYHDSSSLAPYFVEKGELSVEEQRQGILEGFYPADQIPGPKGSFMAKQYAPDWLDIPTYPYDSD